ncbi:unnamed protein product [Prorocentrum cordatum]|uniref:Uncharacterized protein n=1 Tax=Prorocentrum cordatum TaxID=2364126 RepID=A0ABN9U837_9DINO|nr:unnamed protein product [Polarella glacialis]
MPAGGWLWRAGRSGTSKWSCSCWAADNFATRRHCRGCGPEAPRHQVTFKQALLGPTKREAAMQKKLDAMREEFRALKGGNQEKPANEEPQVDLARFFKWAQSCKQERGEDSEECQVALEKYQTAQAEKDSTKPHAAQLSQARYAREKFEKETEPLATDVSWHERQLGEAKARLEKKQEQLHIARAKEQELKEQDSGVRESPAFPTAMQNQFEGTVDGSGISEQEHEQVFTLLGKVLADANQEDMDMDEQQLKMMDQSLLLKNRNGSKQGEYQLKLHQNSGCDGWRCAPAWLSTQPRSRNVPDKRVKKPEHDTATPWTYSGSGWGTIKDNSMEDTQGLQCHAVQGHHLATDKLAVVTQSMQVQGHHMGGAGAAAATGPNGEAGASAGAALAVPRRVGMAHLCGEDDWDISPKAGPGRAAAAWLSIGKGAVLATVYLWTAEGMTCRKTQLIARGIEKLQSLGVPWIIGGDFQVAPEEMAEVESAKVAEATVVAPNAACGTCRHADMGMRAREFKTQGQANKAWTKYMRVLEQEAFQVRGMQRAEDVPRAGRAEEPKWRIKPLNVGGENGPAVRPRRANYIGFERQGIWQARRDMIAAGQLRGGSKGASFQSWVQEAECKMKELEGFNEEDANGLKEVARTFRRRTGIGVDRWRPSMLQGACDDAYSRLLDILRVVECTLIWPAHMATVLFFTIPKTFTADRVTGSLPTTIRAREITREPCMITWARENQRSRDCTSRGKVAEDAAWDVLLSHEMDDPDDESEKLEATITPVLDLVKAFDKMSLHVLWEAGKRLNFNAGALATSTVAVIIAGSKFSACFLKTVIQSTVDGLVVERLRAKWRMHVDVCVFDSSSSASCGSSATPSTRASQVSTFNKLGLKFSAGSQGEGAALASARWLRRTVAKDTVRRGLPLGRACPCLGVDLIAPGTAAKAMSGKRHKGALSRSRRLANLNGGGRKMARVTALCLGVSDHQLRQRSCDAKHDEHYLGGGEPRA